MYKRQELNSALMLGGLTPTTATLRMVKRDFPKLKVITMVRPRGAGFCYSPEDFEVMEAECKELLENGADGIAFGCLREDASLDQEKMRRMTDLIKSMGREAVFHRAFDCSADPFAATEQLISMGIDRILTSGLKPKMCIRDRLVGALLVGVAEAKAIAWAAKKPLVGVHHIEGHVSANYIEHPDLEPPFVCLIVSGGHTHLVVVKDYGEFEILGRTRDCLLYTSY